MCSFRPAAISWRCCPIRSTSIEALARIPLRVHQDIVLTSQMLVDPADTVILLPAATRYETPGGVTQRSTERRIMFCPEIEGRRIGEARPEWEIFLDLARRVRPDLRRQLTFAGTQELREEIARVVPLTTASSTCTRPAISSRPAARISARTGSSRRTDGKAHFIPVPLPDIEMPEGVFCVSTRRGKQFNSMVHAEKDAITGAVRDAVFMNATDAAELRLSSGDAVMLRNDNGDLYRPGEDRARSRGTICKSCGRRGMCCCTGRSGRRNRACRITTRMSRWRRPRPRRWRRIEDVPPSRSLSRT